MREGNHVKTEHLILGLVVIGGGALAYTHMQRQNGPYPIIMPSIPSPRAPAAVVPPPTNQPINLNDVTGMINGASDLFAGIGRLFGK